MTSYFFVAGGCVFAALGLVHGVFSLSDIRRPRRLVPDDLSLIDRMASTGVRLARGRTNMWDAWLGFNLSHSLGAVMFGALCISVGVVGRTGNLPKAALAAPVAIGVMYLILAVRFWFRVPAIGIALGTVLLLLGWLVY
jgi:hypothetical protein